MCRLLFAGSKKFYSATLHFSHLQTVKNARIISALGINFGQSNKIRQKKVHQDDTSHCGGIIKHCMKENSARSNVDVSRKIDGMSQIHHQSITYNFERMERKEKRKAFVFVLTQLSSQCIHRVQNKVVLQGFIG